MEFEVEGVFSDTLSVSLKSFLANDRAEQDEYCQRWLKMYLCSPMTRLLPRIMAASIFLGLPVLLRNEGAEPIILDIH